MIELLDLRFWFTNYDSVFRSYASVFYDRNVLFMQHTFQLFFEGSQLYVLSLTLIIFSVFLVSLWNGSESE